MDETFSYLYLNMDEPTELIKNTFNIINFTKTSLNEEISKTDKRMEGILKEVKEYDNKCEELEKNFFGICQSFEKFIMNSNDHIENKDKEKYKNNIQIAQREYLNSINNFNIKCEEWNKGVEECLSIYKKHSSVTYPGLARKILNDLGKMQALIFKISHKDFEEATQKILTLYQVEYNIMPFTFKPRDLKMYKLSTDKIVNSADSKANFYNKKIHDTILILKEVIAGFMPEYESKSEEDKVFVVDTWKQISGVTDNEFNSAEEVIESKDQIIDLLSQEDVTIHFLEYLNLKRGNSASNLENHAFILMGYLFRKMAEVGYNESTGKINLHILRKLFIMSQTYSTKFKDQKKIYLIRFLESNEGFKKAQFWKPYCHLYLEEEKNLLGQPNIPDYSRKLNNVIYSKLIGLIQVMGEFQLPKEDILSISNEELQKYSIEEKSQKEIINFINATSNSEPKQEFNEESITCNLLELIDEFLYVKNSNKNQVEHNVGFAGSFA
ncbi:MAG: hypothetical protein MJ252_01010 [archaeon]|nr:hypothetical protein [archaeon]